MVLLEVQLVLVDLVVHEVLELVVEQEVEIPPMTR